LDQYNETITNAFEKAVHARKNAYCPYSKFHVGAAVKFKDEEKIFVGCNVENASYGATICAERTAVVSAVAKHGKKLIEFVVVVTDTTPATQPCGLCLQVLAEFCEPSTAIYLANTIGIDTVTSFEKLLPNPFTEFKV
jgi:cytidine deaminase